MNSKYVKIAALALAGWMAMAPVAFAAPVIGATCERTSVRARDTDVFHLTFRGDENARVLVSGDRDTDLDLYLYDENGNLIASDTDMSDQCVVQFRPYWTGTFVIRVVNRGSVYNNYTICVG